MLGREWFELEKLANGDSLIATREPQKLSSPGSKACLRGSARRFQSLSPPRWPGDVSTAASGKLSSCYTEAVLFAIAPFAVSVGSHPAALPTPLGGGHATPRR